MAIRKDQENDLDKEQPSKVVEVPINLELINQKLNYLISLLEK